MPRTVPAAALVLGLLCSGAVWAGAPVYGNPVDPDRMMGRWYEILRAPNKLQRNCYGAYQEWSRQGDAFSIQQVCHRDSPTGKLSELGALAKPLNPQNTLFDASFLGGMVHRKYAVSDHAADYSWLISTTEDGRFPKLLSRAPSMSAAEQDALRQRMARLGFDASRLESVCDPSPVG